MAGDGVARRRCYRSVGAKPVVCEVGCDNLSNPLVPTPVCSGNRVEAIHATALRVLEELSSKVLRPEAYAPHRRGGGVDERRDGHGEGRARHPLDAALASAPRSTVLRAGTRHRKLTLEPGMPTAYLGTSSSHATDIKYGRRAASLADHEELMRLTHFDVLYLLYLLYMLNLLVELQDVIPSSRHNISSKRTLAGVKPLMVEGDRVVALDAFVAQRTVESGVPPERRDR